MKKFWGIVPLAAALLLSGCGADTAATEAGGASPRPDNFQTEAATETEVTAAAADTAALPEIELPVPFESADLHDDFYLPGNSVVNNIPAELLGLRDEDEVNAWLESFPDISETVPDSLSGYANTFLFIKEFEVTRSEAETALTYYINSEDEQLRITDEQLDDLLYGDEEVAAVMFASPYTIVRGGKMYCPNWLYTHSAEDWRAAGITAGDIEDRLPLYKELMIGLNWDAHFEFGAKLYGYITYFARIYENSFDEDIIRAGEMFGQYYKYAVRKHFGFGVTCWKTWDAYVPDAGGYQCLGLYTKNDKSEFAPMDYAAAREYMQTTLRLTDRGFEELCENSPTAYFEKDGTFYKNPGDGGDAGCSYSVITGYERDGDVITYNCDLVGLAEEWGFDEDRHDPFTFRMKQEDGIWKLDGCSDAIGLFHIMSSAEAATETEVTAAGEAEAQPVEIEMPDPYPTGAPDEFYATVDTKLGYIDMSFVDLVDKDEFEEWLDSASSSKSDLTSVGELANLYSFIKHFDIPADTVRSTLVNIRVGDDTADFSDEEIDLLLSGDNEAVAEHFASEWAVQKGENLYSLKWLYYHSAEDYLAAGFTEQELEDAAERFFEMDGERYSDAFRYDSLFFAKIYGCIAKDYVLPELDENSAEEETLRAGEAAGQYYRYAVRRYFGYSTLHASWKCEGGVFTDDGLKCLGLYTKSDRSEYVPMDYAAARQFLKDELLLTDRGFEELCENSPTRYSEKDGQFYVYSGDGGDAGWSYSVITGCERDGDTITYSCDHVSSAKEWGYAEGLGNWGFDDEDRREPFTFRLKLEDGTWKLDGCSDAIGLYHFLSTKDAEKYYT